MKQCLKTIRSISPDIKLRLKILLCGIGSLLTVISFFCSFTFQENKPVYNLNGWGTPQLFCVVAFFILYYSFYVKKQYTCSFFIKYSHMSKVVCIFSFFLSFLYILGKSYHNYNEWLLFCYGPDWFILSLCMMAGMFILINMMLTAAVSFLFMHSSYKKCSKITYFIFEKHSILFPMAVILLCQIPYLFAFYPGVISWDGAFQMGENIGSFDLTWQHPPFVTFLYGFFMKLSGVLQSDNMAIFIFIILQSILSAFAFAYACSCMKVLKTPYWFRYSALIFYAVFTIWPIYATTVIKDSLFYPLTLLYTCMLLQCIYDPKAFVRRRASFTLLFITVLLMILVRHNGTYTFILSFPFVIFLLPKKWKLAGAGTMISVLLAVFCINTFLWPALHVGTRNFRLDLYSVPIQQTARYALYHKDEVTEEEYEILNKVFDYEQLAANYDPEIIDPVKNLLQNDEQGLTYLTILNKEYIRVWIQQGLKHPATYIQSFLNGCYGYFYPDRKEYKEGLGWYISWQIYDTSKFETNFVENRGDLRQALEKLAYDLRQLPGIGILYSCGIYTWFTLAVTLILCIMKKWKAAILSIPLLVNILVCMVSPVNAYIRYALPVYAAAPLLMGWLIYWMRKVQAEYIEN